MRLVVGVTGGVGAGKTAVARAMEARGAKVLSLDELGYRALRDEGVKKALMREFGEGIFDGDEIDRNELAKLVFSDQGRLARLNSIVHPLMRNWAREGAERAEGLVVLEGALVYEMGLESLCDAVVFVSTPRDVRLERVRARGWDAEELARRECAQMPSREKSARADRSVTNDGSEEELGKKVNSILEDMGWSQGSEDQRYRNN